MSELIKNFGVDWRLLLAQAVNFLILLFILKKFAYKPILETLRKRKREIEKGLEFTQAAEEKLKHVEEEGEEILGQARKNALDIVSESENIAKKKKDEIIVEANKKVENIVADVKRAIKEDKAKMGEEVYKSAQDLVRLGIARVLGKMPQEERDQELIKEALRELKSANQ